MGRWNYASLTSTLHGVYVGILSQTIQLNGHMVKPEAVSFASSKEHTAVALASLTLRLGCFHGHDHKSAVHCMYAEAWSSYI